MFARRADRELGRVRDLLRSAGVPAEPVRRPELVERDEQILAALRDEAAAGTVRAVRLPGAGAWRRPAFRLATATAVVVALVVAGIAWQTGRATPADARTPALLHFSDADVATVLAGGGAPADAALARVAAAAADQPVVAGEGVQEVSSYGWYLDATVDATGAAETILAPMFTTNLLRPDGSFVSSEVRAPALDVQGRVVDGQYPPGGQVAGDELPAGTFDAQRAATLPRDPSALRDALVEQYGGADLTGRERSEVLLRAAIDLYQREVVAPDLASALWTAVAGQPGVVGLGQTTDRLGRTGDAVAVPSGHDEISGALVVVVSPDDGRLLEWDDIVTAVPDLGIDAPTVSGFQAFLTSRWVPGP